MAVIGRLFSINRPEKLIVSSFYNKLSFERRWLNADSDITSKTDEELKNSLNISDSCVNRLSEMVDDGNFLRVSVEGGGCSGFQYKFTLDNDLEKSDIVVEKNGVKIVVDGESLEYIKGSTIDYHTELIRSGFRIINNPQAVQGCSCGASFSTKIS